VSPTQRSPRDAMTSDEILDRLVAIAREVEAHRVAAWPLEREQLIAELVLSKWQGPMVEA
jgi:hypothetical protein